MNLVNILSLDCTDISDNQPENINESTSNLLLDGYFNSTDLLYNFSKSYFDTYQSTHKNFLEKLLDLVTEKIRDNKHSYLNYNLYDNEKLNKKVFAISTLKYDVIPGTIIFWMKNNSKSIYKIHKKKINNILTRMKELSKDNNKYKLQFNPEITDNSIVKNIDIVLAFRACYDMKLYKEDKYPLATNGMFLTHLPEFLKKEHSDEVDSVLKTKYQKKYGDKKKSYTIKEILSIIESMVTEYEDLFDRFHDFISDLDTEFTKYMKSTVIYNTTIKKDTIDKRYILLYRTMVNDYVKVVVSYGAVYQFIMKQFLYFISDIELEVEYLEDSVEQK